MNLDRISEALQKYTGQEESMRQVTSVLSEELGENWTQTVFQDLQTLPPALKENLNHAFSYYAATMAWNEIQSYLEDKNLSRTPELEERLPILKHWLEFFGAPGMEAYQSLEDRLNNIEPVEDVSGQETESEVVDDSFAATEDVQDLAEGNEPAFDPSQEDGPNIQEESDQIIEEQSAQENSEEQEDVVTSEELENGDADEDKEESEEREEEQSEVSQEPELNEASDIDDDLSDKSEADVAASCFALDKIQKQLALLDQNQAWLSARCVQLKNIEIYAYPFYGFIVDLLRQVLKDMNAVLADETQAAFIETQFEGGQEAFNRRKEAIEHDIELAEQNCESAVTALISDDVDMDEIKRTLGTIDDSDSVEYVGPAPDGFELLDDETPLDENAIKKQYEKIEKMDALGSVSDSEEKEKNEIVKENTSQNVQKGVQRKLSFSLKRKKPSGDET